MSLHLVRYLAADCDTPSCWESLDLGVTGLHGTMAGARREIRRAGWTVVGRWTLYCPSCSAARDG